MGEATHRWRRAFCKLSQIIMQTEPHEPTLEEYNLNISVYKKYSDKLSYLEGELTNLEQKRGSLYNHLFTFLYCISIFFTFIFFFLVISPKEDFWTSLLGSIFVAILPTLLLQSIFEEIDLLTNLFTFGKFNKLEKATENIKEQTEELKRSTLEKVQPFEKAASDYYQSQLRDFFENNLYKKRSGNQRFEEALSEFSSMIEDLSTMESVFITNSISYWGLQEYRDYLEKRTINHNLQSSKRSETFHSVQNFVKKFSQPRKQWEKQIVAPEKFYRVAHKIDNWDEINKKRRITGQKGEEIAVAIEQEFLSLVGREDLAEKVRHVAKEDGDGLGYDILSFFEDGKEKYIEVKSSKTSLTTPYFISNNELNFLKEHSENAFIYRIFISNDTPELKSEISTEFLQTNEITPSQYIVHTK